MGVLEYLEQPSGRVDPEPLVERRGHDLDVHRSVLFSTSEDDDAIVLIRKQAGESLASVATMNRTLLLVAWLCAAASAAGQGGTTASRGAPTCRPDGTVVRVADLPEGSGLAASRRNPGVLWAHNDSARPVLIKLDENGATQGRVRVTGAEVDDWEDIAVGPCAQQSCIYVADIGDNKGGRQHISVYRVPEPGAGESATAAVEVFTAAYPDGPRDAESLFVTAEGHVYLVTKGDPGEVALYRFPRSLQRGTLMRLERVGEPLKTGRVSAADRPTAADASPDGSWVAVRTTEYVAFYRTSELTAGRWHEASRVDVRHLDEPRGEGIAFGRNGKIFLVGEGGASAGGTFARLTCTGLEP